MTRLIDADSIPWLVEGVGEIPVITKEEIDQMPTVDAVPVRHGRWEKVRGHQMVRRCSECGDIMPRDRAFIHYIYCGHCGAKMVEE
jgi:DNA-directed RNA polymerase subunit RPC12/RpoP